MEEPDTYHDENIHSISWEIPGEVTLDALKLWFADLLWEKTISSELVLFRFKGMAAVKGHPEKHMIQGVHENFDIQASGIAWGDGEVRLNRFAFTGKKLSKSLLRDSFVKYCLSGSQK